MPPRYRVFHRLFGLDERLDYEAQVTRIHDQLIQQAEECGCDRQYLSFCLTRHGNMFVMVMMWVEDMVAAVD